MSVRNSPGPIMDWTDCAAIEVVPGLMSGAPVLRGSRVRPSDLLLNAHEGAEWLSDAHFLPLDQVEEVLRFYERHKRQLAAAV